MFNIFELKKRLGQKDGLYHVHQQGMAKPLSMQGEPLVVKSRSEARGLLTSLGVADGDTRIQYGFKMGPATDNSFMLRRH